MGRPVIVDLDRMKEFQQRQEKLARDFRLFMERVEVGAGAGVPAKAKAENAKAPRGA